MTPIPAKISRRRVLQAGAAAGALALTAALPGCRRAGNASPGAGKNVLKVFNWSDYIAADL
ncbi:MAG: twin-arginine translocation signal domain-containing protein, partial [Pirellulaceae bacterium]